jgi:RNA polymerase sigma-70 factor (ECF subfamily)
MNSLPNADDSPEHLLRQARVGCTDALGRLLELYRNYLRLLARTQIDLTLRVRLDPSDLVQESLLEAFRDFQHFAGTSEKELVAWLRRILVRNLADQVKHHKAQARDWGRQESLEALLDRSSSAAEQALARGISTPSSQAARREQAVLLADALARLPPDYREVIVLRNLEHLKFEEIAARLGRSAGAVRMLWSRALEKLGRLMEARS